MRDDVDSDRELRTRLAWAEDTLSRVATEGPPGTLVLFGRTVAIGTYPTSANAWYGVQPCAPAGNEVEGQPATVENLPTYNPVLAYNTGATVPPVGTVVILFNNFNSWYF